MPCQPGYIEMPDGNCVYEFGGGVQPDGTPTTDPNTGGGFWQQAGDFVKTNGGDILVVLGGILGGGKKDNAPATDPTLPPPADPPKKDRTLLWIGIGLVVLVAGFWIFKKAKPAIAA